MDRLISALRLSHFWIEGMDSSLPETEFHYLEMLVEYWARCVNQGFTIEEIGDILTDTVRYYRALQLLNAHYGPEVMKTLVLDEVERWAETKSEVSYPW